MKISEEALNHLKSLQVDPSKMSEEEYFMATHIQMPRLIYKGNNNLPLPAYQTRPFSKDKGNVHNSGIKVNKVGSVFHS